MIVSIHQPAYLPWMGYFDKIARSDVFVYLDTVQFQKSSFQNRNKIPTQNGPLWLTVPVQTKGKLYDTLLKDLEIDNRQNWANKHIKTIEATYKKSPEYSEVYRLIKHFYESKYEHLSNLCFEMMVVFNELLQIKTKIVKASDLDPLNSQKSDLVLDLCKTLGATEYLSGSLGRDYLKEQDFSDAAIAITYQDYKQPIYRQNSEVFTPFMGIIDLLMNESKPNQFFKVVNPSVI